MLGCRWEIGAAFYFGDSAPGADACAFSRLMLQHDCKERHFLQKASSSVSPSTRESSIGGSSLPVAVVPTQQSCGGWLTLGGPLSTGVLVGGSEVLHSFPCLHRVSPNAGGKGRFHLYCRLWPWEGGFLCSWVVWPFGGWHCPWNLGCCSCAPQLGLTES